MMLLATVFVACSDDDDEKDDDKPTTKQKLVSKIVESDSDGSEETLFEYDKNGLISKITNEEETYKFTIEDTKITVETYEEGSVRYKEEYQLNDKRLVTSCKYNNSYSSTDGMYNFKTDFYTYDDNNQLIKCGDYTFTWKDGNITEQKDNNGFSYAYNYFPNEYKSYLGWFVGGLEDFSNHFIMDYGYMGKRNKNLVKQTTEIENMDQSTYTYEYKYDSDGYVTSIKEYVGTELNRAYTITYKE